MTAKKTTKEQDDEIIKLYCSNTKPKEIQNLYNISISTFNKILKDNNIAPFQAKRYSLDDKKIIAEAYKNGKSAKNVGLEFNVAESNVLKFCKELGIEVRKSSERVSDRFLNQSEKEDIIKMYQDGISPKIIGEKYDMFNNSITRFLKNNGIERNQLIKLNDEQKLYIKEQYLLGESSETIAKELSISPTAVCRNLLKQDIEIIDQKYNHRKHEIDYHWLDNIDSEEKAYFLGLLWSDGNVSSRGNTISIRLLNTDRDILEKLSQIIYGFSNLSTEKDGTYKMCNLTINSKDFKDKLSEYGCFPNKSATIKYPTFLADDLNRHFIRGLMDGDGSICYTDRVVACLSGNIFIINSFKEILQKYFKKNINIIIQNKKNTETYNAYIYQKKNIEMFFKWLYKDSSLFLNRKYDRFSFLIDRMNKNKQGSYGTTLIPTFNNIELNKNNILLMTDETKQEVSDLLFNYFRTNGFPFCNFNNYELQHDWLKLQNYNTSSVISNQIINSKNISKFGMKIFKQFADHYYLVSNKKPSLFQAFNDDNILKNVINNRLGITYKETFSINGNAIKQGLKVTNSASQVSVFNTVIAKTIYDKYTKPNDIVYDFSMGFGQRLLGAMACENNLTYIGVDPWRDALPSLKKIAKFIKKYDSCELYRSKSEVFCPQHLHGKIDFAFSSPPYYDIEIYDKHRSQANFGRTYDQFINEWWKNTALNLHTLLKQNGKLALNMKASILEDMKTILLDNGFKYIETIFMRSPRKHLNQDFVDEPIAVFEKI